MILVKFDNNGPVSYYWGDVAYRWESPLLETVKNGEIEFSVLSRANLLKYRSDRKLRQPDRWRDMANGPP